MPRDSSKSMKMEKETQYYHMGQSYYGPGYGHFANLSPQVEMKEYPKPYRSLENDAYADTIQEIDGVERDNNRQVDRQRSRSMY